MKESKVKNMHEKDDVSLEDEISSKKRSVLWFFGILFNEYYSISVFCRAWRANRGNRRGRRGWSSLELNW